MNQSLEQESGESQWIQRLVDGELAHEVRSRQLSNIKSDSPMWREIALAFVEKQLFDEALGAVTTCEQPADSHSAINEKQPPRTSRSSPYRSSVVSWIAGLVACLLVGFFVGFVLSDSDSDIEPAGRVGGPAPSKALLVAEPVVDEATPVSLDLADALSRSVVPVPNEFRRALRKAGYSLSDRRTITNVSLPSGGQIELPVRHVDVKFVGINTFQ